MEIWLNFVLGVISLGILYRTVNNMPLKALKDLHVKIGFLKGIDFSCSFFEDQHIDQ